MALAVNAGPAALLLARLAWLHTKHGPDRGTGSPIPAAASSYPSGTGTGPVSGVSYGTAQTTVMWPVRPGRTRSSFGRWQRPSSWRPLFSTVTMFGVTPVTR